MTESYEGKLQLMELKTKLDDHSAQQAIDMNELKATTLRIESKLDIKSDRDEVAKVAAAVEHKADKEDVKDIAVRLWWLIGILFVSGLGLGVWMIEEAIRGRFRV